MKPREAEAEALAETSFFFSVWERRIFQVQRLEKLLLLLLLFFLTILNFENGRVGNREESYDIIKYDNI